MLVTHLNIRFTRSPESIPILAEVHHGIPPTLDWRRTQPDLTPLYIHRHSTPSPPSSHTCLRHIYLPTVPPPPLRLCSDDVIMRMVMIKEVSVEIVHSARDPERDRLITIDIMKP